MSRVGKILSRIFRRGHPDIYQALKAYAEKTGKDPEDVVAAAVAAYMASDEKGKEELERAMSERRRSGPDVMAAVKMFTEMGTAMAEMFKAINDLRSSLSVSTIVQDYKTLVGAAQEIKKMGSEGGEGSIEELAAKAFFESIFGSLGKGGSSSASSFMKRAKKTGVGKVRELEEESEEEKEET
jgi:hypothetical protein